MPKRSHHRLLRALPFVEHSAPANEYVEGEVDFRVTECGAVGLGGVVLPIAVGPLLHAVQQSLSSQSLASARAAIRAAREGGAEVGGAEYGQLLQAWATHLHTAHMRRGAAVTCCLGLACSLGLTSFSHSALTFVHALTLTLGPRVLGPRVDSHCL